MTLIEIIDTFTFYGVDVLVLAICTCLATQIIKAIFMKNCKKKMLTFVPFIIGTAFYTAYYALKCMDIRCIMNEYVSLIEHGFSVGALSTVIYVWYEQFIREKQAKSASAGVIETLIEGYVPTDKIEATAQKIAEAIEKDVTGNGAAKAVDILCDVSEEDVTERDVRLLAKLIIETLAHIYSN